MSISASITKTSEGNWLFEWTATTAPYEIWLDGDLIETTTETEYEYSGVANVSSPPMLEIIDATEDAESNLYSPFLNIQWRGSILLSAYAVEELVGSSWVERALVSESGSGYYTYRTRVFSDGTNASWRVRSVDSYGNRSSDCIAFQMEIVCNPEPPSVTLDLSGGTLTIDEA